MAEESGKSRQYAETPIPKTIVKAAVVKPSGTKGETPVPKVAPPKKSN